VIPETRLRVCAIAADNGWLEVTDVGLVVTDRFECGDIYIDGRLVATDRFECDAIISCA
jgi:hypothetical protein